MELQNKRVGDFCKRIKSQQSDLAIKIPVRHEIQKKNRRIETLKNEVNQCQFTDTKKLPAFMVYVLISQELGPILQVNSKDMRSY